MNRLHALALGTALLAAASAASAADRQVYLPLQEAVAAAQASGKIDGSVKFYLAGNNPGGQVLVNGIVSNKRSNAFGKSDTVACNWSAQSAIISLHQAAKNAGANAVTNIVSFFKKREYKDSTNYECFVGTAMAAVTLRGNLVKLP